MSTDIRVDSFKNSQTWQKSDFAAAMGCDTGLVDSVDSFTASIKGNCPAKRAFRGHLEKRYCGRFYLLKDFENSPAENETAEPKVDADSEKLKGEGTIWIGVVFDVFLGSRFMVAFWDGMPGSTNQTHFQEKLEKLHYAYTSRYETAPAEGYWHFVPVQDYLDDIILSKEKVEAFIDAVLKTN